MTARYVGLIARWPTPRQILENAGVAQLVEQLFRKQQVARSIRVAGSIIFRILRPYSSLRPNPRFRFPILDRVCVLLCRGLPESGDTLNALYNTALYVFAFAALIARRKARPMAARQSQ
jgi:hypothetical protein